MRDAARCWMLCLVRGFRRDIRTWRRWQRNKVRWCPECNGWRFVFLRLDHTRWRKCHTCNSSNVPAQTPTTGASADTHINHQTT